MNSTHTLAILSDLKPLAWLVLLLALYFCGQRRGAGSPRPGAADPESLGSPAPPSTSPFADAPPSYRALGIFAALRLCSSLAYPLLICRVLPLGLSMHRSEQVYTAIHSGLAALTVVCLFFVMQDMLRTSLSPLPGLASAANLVFRWIAALALLLALTAHLPFAGFSSFHAWLDAVNVSVTLSVLFLEATMLLLLLLRLQRLGLCLRSRVVGLSFGLTLMGVVNAVAAIAAYLPHGAGTTLRLLGELTIYGVLTMWVLYVVRPEPRRHHHSLSPASKLMRWNEIALKLDLPGHRPAEQTPFISGVQLIVDSILDKYKIGQG